MLEAFKEREDFLIAASLLGENEIASSSIKETLEEFVCWLYNAKSELEVKMIFLIKLFFALCQYLKHIG